MLTSTPNRSPFEGTLFGSFKGIAYPVSHVSWLQLITRGKCRLEFSDTSQTFILQSFPYRKVVWWQCYRFIFRRYPVRTSAGVFSLSKSGDRDSSFKQATAFRFHAIRCYVTCTVGTQTIWSNRRHKLYTK